MNAVTLKPGRERSVLQGHPWIFSGAIESGCDIPAATPVQVFSSKSEVLGTGIYSPASMIRVRLLKGDIKDLVRKAIGKRTFLSAASAARLIYAENDGIPGLIVDSYANHFVLQITSALAEYYKPQILEVLQEYHPKSISERLDTDARKKEGLEVGTWRLLAGDNPPDLIEIEENGLKFLVDIRKGHKTGYYLDQREARALVGSLSKDKTVLNCFCYTGGFGLYAACGGAKEVTQVDLSEEALALAQKNAELNAGGLKSTPTIVRADVFKYLRFLRDAGRHFDLIVLDPPKFAESKSQLMKAARGYKDINLLAMKLLAPGGTLATFSCSGAMTPEFFDTILREASVDAKRDFQIIARTRQASDHPVALNFPEGLYLKGVVLRAND